MALFGRFLVRNLMPIL